MEIILSLLFAVSVSMFVHVAVEIAYEHKVAKKQKIN
tara:strand:- start:4407 stop:4517 length:111 start_codon:yes stop_codon:yes gene_type:complete